MKADNLSRRLSALEDDPEEDLVAFSYQWLNEDGTPAGPLIERRIPRSRYEMFNFEWIDEK